VLRIEFWELGLLLLSDSFVVVAVIAMAMATFTTITTLMHLALETFSTHWLLRLREELMSVTFCGPATSPFFFQVTLLRRDRREHSICLDRSFIRRHLPDLVLQLVRAGQLLLLGEVLVVVQSLKGHQSGFLLVWTTSTH